MADESSGINASCGVRKIPPEEQGDGDGGRGGQGTDDTPWVGWGILLTLLSLAALGLWRAVEILLGHVGAV